jgi:APA family basic amino acid/polyamine antiporter
MASQPPSGFRQQLGLFDATMIVAGSMIGSGIFIVAVYIARDVGSAGWLLLVWAVTGVMTIIGALSYAELAAMLPAAGGQYVYLREAYGPLWSFLFGWTSFLIIQCGYIAAVSVAFAKFLGVLAPSLGTDHILYEIPDLNIHIALAVPWMEEPLSFFRRPNFTISAGQLVAVGVTVFQTGLNLLGVREGKWVQNLFTVAKIAGLLFLIVVGLTVAADREVIERNLQSPWSGIVETEEARRVASLVPVTALAALLVFFGAMVGSLFSSDAWGNVAFAAAEVRNPRRNLPRSLLCGASLVMVLYLLANSAYVASLPVTGDRNLAERLAAEARLAQTPEARAALDEKYAAAVRQLGISHARDDRVGTAVLQLAWPGLGVNLMALAIMVSTFGCVNGLVLSAARLYWAMARDGLFFRTVGNLNTRGVPTAALLLQGLWSVVLIFSGSYNELLDYTIFAALLFYVLTIAGVFVLRQKHPEWERPYRAPGYPLLPALYIVLCTVIMLTLLLVRPVYSWPSFIIILSGVPVYWFWRWRSRPPLAS